MSTTSQFGRPDGVPHCSISPHISFPLRHRARGGSQPPVALLIMPFIIDAGSDILSITSIITSCCIFSRVCVCQGVATAEQGLLAKENLPLRPCKNCCHCPLLLSLLMLCVVVPIVRFVFALNFYSCFPGSWGFSTEEGKFSTPLELQSRFGDKALKFQVVYPQN